MTTTGREDNQIELLAKWRTAIRVSHKAHVRTAAFMQRRNRALGIPVVVLSTIAGTTAFATLESSPELWVKILVGLLSVAAAVLASLQTFLGYSELAERHKSSSQRYGALRREIEEALALHQEGTELPQDFIKTVRTRWDRIDEESPSLSQSLYDEIARDIWPASST